MHSRPGSRWWWALVVLLSLWLPSSLALAQAPVAGPAVLWQFRTPDQAPSGRFHLVHN